MTREPPAVAVPGMLVLWSGDALRHDVHRIPADGLVLGRDQVDASDVRVSRRHVELRVKGRLVTVTDLGSRNGTFVGGGPVERGRGMQTPLPAIVRAGRTVGVVLADVRRHEDLAFAGEDVGPVLVAARREVDEAARAEENLTIEGPHAIAIELARRYAATLGGDVLEFDPRRGATLEGVLAGARPRTVIMVLIEHALVLGDMPEIRTWLETDVRFVTLAAPGATPLSMLEPEAIASLRRRTVQVWPRFEVVPAKVVEIVKAEAPGATLHATLVESALRAASDGDVEGVYARLRAGVRRWWAELEAMDDELRALRGIGAQAMVRGDDVDLELFGPAPAVCVVGRMK